MVIKTFVALAVLACFICNFCDGHPLLYQMTVTTNRTNDLSNKVPAGVPVKVYFQIYDLDNKFVTFDQLRIMHARYMHVAIISHSWEVFWHFHPEDFGDVSQMSADGKYWVEVTFPMSGAYLINVDLYPMMESAPFPAYGVGTINVNGGPAQGPRVDKLGQQMANVKGYPGHAGDRYVDPFYINQLVYTDDQMGYMISASMRSYPTQIKTPMDSMGMDGMDSMNGQNLTFNVYACIALELTINNTMGENAVDGLEPYLDAAMHVLLIHEDNDKVYHVHGMIDAPHHMEEMMNTTIVPWCDDDKAMLAMPMPPSSFGPNMMAMFYIDKPGRYNVIIEMKSNDGTQGTLLIPMYQFNSVLVESPPDDPNGRPATVSVAMTACYALWLMTFLSAMLLL